MTAVEWLVEQLKERGYAGEFPPHLLFEQAKEMEKEQMIEFACKVVEVSSEKYIQGNTTEQIAKELLTYKSE